MSGQELFNNVFADEIEKYGVVVYGEIEYIDGVTCYDERMSGMDGWYIETTISFRYQGKKYAFERYDHSSDNVCDTRYDVGNFREVVSNSELDKAIDKIIKNIEDETLGSWNELVASLEDLKRQFYYINE